MAEAPAHFPIVFIRRIFSPFNIFILIIGCIAIFVASRFDAEIINAIGTLRNNELNLVLKGITNYGLALAISATCSYLIIKKKYSELVILVIASTMSLEIAHVLKKFFHLPRPYQTEMGFLPPISHALGYSFPSMHAAFCLTVWPFVYSIFRKNWLRVVAYLTIVLIIFSRLYLGVHYLSDLIAGGLIGITIAQIVIVFERSYHVGSWLVHHLVEKIELRRQVAHLLCGVILIFLVKINWLNLFVLGVILLAGTLLVLITRYHKIPVINRVLTLFERRKELIHFPGKGAFFFVLGSFLSLLFFERNIALASIAIMAVGDSLTTVVGTYFGRYKNPLNPSKHLEGSAIAIIFSTLAAFSFVDLRVGLIGSIFGIIAEALTVKVIDRIIDDNLIIPLVAGMAMTWVS